MSHYTVLVIGEKDNNLDKALDPFWELDLSEAEMKLDKRAVFRMELKEEELDQKFKEHIEWRVKDNMKSFYFKCCGNENTTDDEKKVPNCWKCKKPMKDETDTRRTETALNIEKEEKAGGRKWAKDYYGGYVKGKGWGYYHNPNAKWDWYQVGGRWTGFFKLKKNTVGKRGEPSLLMFMDRTRKEIEKWEAQLKGRADQVYKGDVDWEGMMEESGIEAGKKYDKMCGFFGGKIPVIEFPWQTVLDDKQFKDMDIETKRKFYHSQDALKKHEAIKKLALDDKKKLLEFKGKAKKKQIQLSEKDRDLLIWENLADYQMTRQEFVDRARAGAISTFAVLKDGKWYEKGEMGWWAIVSNEKDRGDWLREYQDLVLALPDNTLLTVVDCHI